MNFKVPLGKCSLALICAKGIFLKSYLICFELYLTKYKLFLYEHIEFVHNLYFIGK